MMTAGSTWPERAGVASPDIEAVVVERDVEVAERLFESLAPLLRANTSQGGVTELLVVGLAPPEGMMGQLQVRSEPPIEEQGRADAGPEGDDELEAGAAHDVEALKIGVVYHPHGSTEASRQAGGELEASSSAVTSFCTTGAPAAVERVTRFGAVSTTPLRTTPGKPTETRSKDGSGAQGRPRRR